MIKQLIGTKLGSAVAVAAVVISVGSIATVSAAKPSTNAGNPDLSGYTKDQCKNGGWQNFKNADGSPMFKNQGQCVSYFASGGKKS